MLTTAISTSGELYRRIYDKNSSKVKIYKFNKHSKSYSMHVSKTLYVITSDNSNDNRVPVIHSLFLYPGRARPHVYVCALTLSVVFFDGALTLSV